LSDVCLGVEDGRASTVIDRFLCSLPGCGASFTHINKTKLLWHCRLSSMVQPTLTSQRHAAGEGGDGDYVAPVKKTGHLHKCKPHDCEPYYRPLWARLFA